MHNTRRQIFGNIPENLNPVVWIIVDNNRVKDEEKMLENKTIFGRRKKRKNYKRKCWNKARQNRWMDKKIQIEQKHKKK